MSIVTIKNIINFPKGENLEITQKEKCMTQEERLDFLISQLLCESAEYKDIPVPTAQEEKRQLLRALMNVRPPRPASDEFLRVQDEYLKERLAERGGMTTLKDLSPAEPGISHRMGIPLAVGCHAGLGGISP